MALLNYTTKVEAARTVAEIQTMLQKHGARSVLTNYDEHGQVESLSFTTVTSRGEIPFRLPVDPDAVLRVLQRAYSQGQIRNVVDRPQAVRVAWRIVKDWVEAQLAIIETEMVKFEQIFLPYAQGEDGRTFYEMIEERNFKLLSIGREEMGIHAQEALDKAPQEKAEK